MIDLLEGLKEPSVIIAVVAVACVSFVLGRRHERNKKEDRLRLGIRTELTGIKSHRKANDEEDIRLIKERQELRHHKISLDRWEADLGRREAEHEERIQNQTPSLTLVSGTPEPIAEAIG